METPPPGRLDTQQRYTLASGWTCLHFLLWALLFYAAMFVIPRDMRIFEEFDTELPQATVQMINVSLLVGKYWYAVVFLGPVALALDWLVLATLGKLGRNRVIIVGVLLALVPLVLGAIGFAGIQIGYSKLYTDLTRAGDEKPGALPTLVVVIKCSSRALTDSLPPLSDGSLTAPAIIRVIRAIRG